MSSVTPYTVRELAFWRCYWVTARPYLFFISGVSGSVGLAVTQQTDWGRLAAVFIACFLSYGLGQALTDVFQIDTDAISSPYRPLTRGLIGRGQVLAVSLLGLGLCALVFVLLNPLTLIPSLLAVVGLLTYTPFKRRFWGGPVWNSWIVGLLPLIAYLCVAPADYPGLPLPVLLSMVSVALSYAIFVLLGYLKDISADRTSGYQTFPVRFGWAPTVVVSLLFAAGAIVASFTLMSMSGIFQRPFLPAEGLASLGWLLGTMMLLTAHWQLLPLRDEKKAHLGIALVVRGYLLLHLGETAAFMPALIGPSIAFYALFELSLGARPERSQI